jgi:hypothetical protein
MASPACKNSADPLFLPIGYNYVSSDGLTAPSWGIEVGLGLTPRQKFSLSPSFYDHSTVANVDHCSADDYGCLASFGGIYNPELSTTELPAASISDWNGTIGTDDASDYYYYNDVLTVGGNESAAVWGFPFTTDDGGDWGMLLD